MKIADIFATNFIHKLNTHKMNAKCHVLKIWIRIPSAQKHLQRGFTFSHRSDSMTCIFSITKNTEDVTNCKNLVHFFVFNLIFYITWATVLRQNRLKPKCVPTHTYYGNGCRCRCCYWHKNLALASHYSYATESTNRPETASTDTKKGGKKAWIRNENEK